MAVKLWLPIVKLDDFEAWPLLNDAVPKLVDPSKNSTVPVGVPVPGETEPTTTFKVTDVP